MAIHDSPGVLEKAITRAITDRANEIMHEEANRAADRVKERMKEIAPQLAMTVLRMFEVERCHDNIIIKVSNKLVDPLA